MTNPREVEDGLEVVWDYGPPPAPVLFSDLAIADQEELRLAFPRQSAFNLEIAVDHMLMLLAKYFEIRRSQITETVLRENSASESIADFMKAARHLVDVYTESKPNSKALIHKYWLFSVPTPKALKHLERAVSEYEDDVMRLKRGRGAPKKKDDVLAYFADKLVETWLLTTGAPAKFTSANRDSVSSFFGTLLRATAWEISAKLETSEVGIDDGQQQGPKDAWHANTTSRAQASHILRAIQDALTRRRRQTSPTIEAT